MNMTSPFFDETLVFIYREVVDNYLPTFIKEMEYTPWVFSLLGSAVIGLSGILPLLIIPAQTINDKNAKFNDRKYICSIYS